MAARLHLNHRRLERWRRGPRRPTSPREVQLPPELTTVLATMPEGDRVSTCGLAQVGLPELELARVRPDLRQTARRLLPVAARALVWRLLEAASRPVVVPELRVGAEVDGIGLAVGITAAGPGALRLHPPGRPDGSPTPLLQRARRLLPPHDHARPVRARPLDPAELTRLRRRFLDGLGARLFVCVGTRRRRAFEAAWMEVVRWGPTEIRGRHAPADRAPWGARWGEWMRASPGAVLAWRIEHADGRVEGGPGPPFATPSPRDHEISSPDHVCS